MKPEIQAVLDGESDGCIVTGDSGRILPGLPLAGFDEAVITDPPYGVGFRNEDWDAIIPEIATKLPKMFSVCEIITAPTTMWDYPRPDWILNWSRPGSTSRTKSGTFNHWSPVLVYGTKGPNPDSLILPGCGYPPGAIDHPSPKPLRLMEWLIGAVSASIILDPFCGSGTTCVAAKKLGRRYIGIEISPKYAEITRNRLATTPKPLFTEPAEKPEQAELFAEKP